MSALARFLAEVLVWTAACVGIWLLTLSSVSRSELLVALACALPCALLAAAGRRAVQGSWAPRPSWLRWLLPLPLAVAGDTARVLGRAVAALAGRRPIGAVRSVALRRDRPAARWRARQAVAAALVSATPGTVVVDVDGDTGRMALHALGAGRPAMEEVVSR
jgi:multisubunit Na+/H+ antiporter MnhE subunit